MIKKISVISIMLVITLSMMSCQVADILTGEKTPDKDWDLIVDSAKNTTVNLYVTKADEEMRAWLSSKYYKHLMETYNIELNVKILSFEDIMYTLEVDVLNEEKNGELDLLLLQDDEFRKFNEKQFLYPDIADKVLNLKDNINVLELDVNSEHGYPLDGLGVAFARTQFVLMFDEDVLETYPIDTTELLEFAKENPDTFTYPNPMTDETGGEFIRTVIYELIGQEKMETLFLGEITEAELEIMIKPALDYLKRLDAYILKDEGIYFKSIESVDQAFKDGLLYFSMSQDFAYAVDAINNETYPDGARSFIFENGTIMDTMYFAVPMNASNKTGAIVAINEMLSIQLQLDKYTPSNWGNLPIVDLNLMNESDAASFGKASVKRNTVRVEELAIARYNELPMSVIEMINKLWDTHVNQ